MTAIATGGFRFRTLFPETPLLTIADIGAGDDPNNPLGLEGITGLCTTGDAVLYGFDGDERSFAAVEGLQTESRRYLPYFIGDGGERTYYETNSPFTGSLYRPHRRLVDQFDGLGAVMRLQRSFPVQTRRLDDIPDLPPVDAIKLDIQGAELDVLRGAERQLQNTVLIQTEVEFVPLYQGQPLYGDIDAFLRAHGFLLLTFFHIHKRIMKPAYGRGADGPSGTQALWTDAVFIRDFTKLDVLNDAQMLKLAALLHDVYAAVDVAAYFLQHLDARSGGDDRLRRYAGQLKAEYIPPAGPA